MNIDIRKAAFFAEHRRKPTPEELRQLEQDVREARRQADGERHEAGLKRAYLGSNPDASESDWQREKGGILAEDRKRRTTAADDAARTAQGAMYRNF